MRHVVAIASAGRPGVLGEIVRSLRNQTIAPDEIVVSVPADTDAADQDQWPTVRLIHAERGLTKQRNAVLDVLDDDVDLVTFLDDDVLLAPDYLEALQRFVDRRPEVVLFSGRVVRDGALLGEISYSDAQEALDGWMPEDVEGPPHVYGCNMTARVGVARRERFDERLPLYGWLEDRDFTMRCLRHGPIAQYWGAGLVHLGVSSGRVSGVRMGFSQVVNPVYLWRKGSLALGDVVPMVAKAVLANLRGLALRDPRVDRRGRLRGNLLGCAEVLRGCRPENAVRH